MEHRTKRMPSMKNVHGAALSTCPWPTEPPKAGNITPMASNGGMASTQPKQKIQRRFSMSHEMSHNMNQIYADTHNLRLREPIHERVLRSPRTNKSPSSSYHASPVRQRAKSIAFEQDSPSPQSPSIGLVRQRRQSVSTVA